MRTILRFTGCALAVIAGLGVSQALGQTAAERSAPTVSAGEAR